MPDARHQVTIRRPASEVFAFIADGLNGPRWRSGITDIALVSGSGVGATYKQGVKGPGGRRVDADYRITTYEPNSRLAFEAIAAFRWATTYPLAVRTVRSMEGET